MFFSMIWVGNILDTAKQNITSKNTTTTSTKYKQTLGKVVVKLN